MHYKLDKGVQMDRKDKNQWMGGIKFKNCILGVHKVVYKEKRLW